MSSVRIEGLQKQFRSHTVVRALHGVSVHVEEGELLVLLGPSGCGKTTLLRCVAGLERPSGGRIHVDGVPMFDGDTGVEVPAHKRDIGMVFQNYALWPHMTVLDNVAYPLRARGVAKSERRARAQKALELVDCGALTKRIPSALSGGQQQRVALARAVVAEPRLMLFDEPLSNLDFRLRVQLRQEIRLVHQTLKFTGIYVTHDQTEAFQVGTRVAVMRDGQIEQIDDAATVFGAPATPYVAEFLGIENRLQLRRSGAGWVADGAGPISGVGAIALPGDDALLFARAADVELAAGTGHAATGHDAAGAGGDEPFATLPGVVHDVLFSGTECEWLVDVGTARIRAVRRADMWPFRPGDKVEVRLPLLRALLYPSAGSGGLVRPAVPAVPFP